MSDQNSLSKVIKENNYNELNTYLGAFSAFNHNDCQLIIQRDEIAGLQRLEEAETSSIFPLRAAAHVIGWDARSSKAEMD